MRKVFGIALLACLMFCSAASAASLRVSDALKIARHEVPRSCRLQDIDEYSDAYGIGFRDFNDFRNYTVYVDKLDGRPLARHMSSSNFVGSTNIGVSKEDVTRSAFARYRDIRNIRVVLEAEGHNNVRYHLSCGNDKYAIDAYYNPVTGALGKEVIVYRYKDRGRK